MQELRNRITPPARILLLHMQQEVKIDSAFETTRTF